jgi:Pyruvate/2-oxoacid:ferredoxin oxidoreductase gamma subunit
MLGGLIKKTNVVSQDSILKSISNTIPSRYIKLNNEAFFKGYEYLK